LETVGALDAGGSGVRARPEVVLMVRKLATAANGATLPAASASEKAVVQRA
jgi:hypothetical protein